MFWHLSSTCVVFDVLPQVDLSRINALIAQNAGLKAMLEEEHLQLEVSAEPCVLHAPEPAAVSDHSAMMMRGLSQV